MSLSPTVILTIIAAFLFVDVVPGQERLAELVQSASDLVLLHLLRTNNKRISLHR